jgi:two-component system CheB/CheR fusion protein
LSELLDITRIESGRLLVDPTPFDLVELIGELQVDITHIYPDYKITLTNHARETRLEADRDKINQVLTNLLVNAIKYSPDSREIAIELVNPSPQEIRVCITDHGIGIDVPDHERIFERFYRVPGHDEKAYSGFGIGLYLAKEIVEQHRGFITVESEKGKGSTFAVTIPLAFR